MLSIRGFDDTCIAHSVNMEYTNDGDAPLLSILTRPYIRTPVHPYAIILYSIYNNTFQVKYVIYYDGVSSPGHDGDFQTDSCTGHRQQ